MKSFPLYTQLDQMDCGPTCLRMIAKFYGKQFSVQLLRDRSFITRLGVSILGISDAAEYIGFRTMYVRCDFEQLYKEAPLPCILHWNQNHFVVCYKIKRKKNFFSGESKYIIYLADPSGEKYTMNEYEFKKCWMSDRSNDKEVGIALLLTPTPSFYQSSFDDENGKKDFRYFLKYITPHKYQFLQLMIAMLIGSFIALLSPFLTQAVVDQGIGNNNLDFITLVLIAQVTISVVSMCMGFITSWISLYMNTQINISLISDYLGKLMRLPLKCFDSKNLGDIIQRIGDHGRIEEFLLGSALTIVFSAANFIVFSIIMAYYNSTILLIFLLGNAIYTLWVLSFMRYRRKLDLKRFTQSSSGQSNLYGMLTTMQDIKLNNCELQQRWKWERIQIKLFKIGIEGVTIGQIQTVGSVFFSQITNVVISYLSAKAVIEGEFGYVLLLKKLPIMVLKYQCL